MDRFPEEPSCLLQLLLGLQALQHDPGPAFVQVSGCAAYGRAAVWGWGT